MPGEAADKPRVLILHNFLSPYRVPLFNALSELVELDVWFLADVKTIREWPSEYPDAAFRHAVLPNRTLGFGSRYDAIILNHTLPWALAARRFDAIIVCGWAAPAMVYAGLHAWTTGTPFIVWSGSTPGEPSPVRTVSLPMVKGFVRLAQSWIAYGTRARDYLVELGAEKEKTYCAYNTVETEWFAKESAESTEAAQTIRNTLGLGEKPLVLYCGNLLDLKGVPDLIQAFGAAASAIPDVHLVLAGSGEGQSRYQTMCVDLGIESRVHFVGFIDRRRLPAYYAMADVLVVPSRREVWGLVINEALACGVPVIASDAAGATADLIEDHVNGLIVPSRNPDAIAKALRVYFTEAEVRDRLKAAARTSVAPFTIARAAQAFADAVAAARSSA
ncbi:MAG: hypothetical protein AMXMBFR84_40990 [Candidatus Hydrogenedentota bacterium]